MLYQPRVPGWLSVEGGVFDFICYCINSSVYYFCYFVYFAFTPWTMKSLYVHDKSELDFLWLSAVVWGASQEYYVFCLGIKKEAAPAASWKIFSPFFKLDFATASCINCSLLQKPPESVRLYSTLGIWHSPWFAGSFVKHNTVPHCLE